MKVFFYEMKKLWNWRILLVIAALGALVWFAMLRESIDSYDSLTKHGIYGSYQTEMFRLYDETLEPEELAEYNLPQKYAEVQAAGDAIITKEPVFAKYGITDFAAYLDWRESEEYWDFLESTNSDEAAQEDEAAMSGALNGSKPDLTLDEWYSSPMMRWQSLKALEGRYVGQQAYLDTYIQNDLRPTVVRAAERLSATGNNSLINEYLMQEFTIYAAVAGVFIIVAVIAFVTPLLIVDRSRSIHYLQYSSAKGRGVFRVQLVSVIISALALSAVLVALIFAPFVKVAGEYWNTGIMSLGGNGMWLYDLTFGQSVLVIAGAIIALCVGAACFAFVLSRFSSNIVTVMIKTVPVAAALSVVTALSVVGALSYNNFVHQVFRGSVDTAEVIVCCVVGAIGIIAAAFVALREKRVDVA